MIYIGIDPGKKGGIAKIENGCAESFAYSDEVLISTLKSVDKECVCIVEKVGAMPGQGVTSMFNFGRGFGYILGVLEAFKIPYQLVPPQKWKKEYSLGHNKGDSITVCKRLFPSVSLLPTERCRTDSDGMAEALLMAEYGRRISGRE